MRCGSRPPANDRHLHDFDLFIYLIKLSQIEKFYVTCQIINWRISVVGVGRIMFWNYAALWRFFLFSVEIFCGLLPLYTDSLKHLSLQELQGRMWLTTLYQHIRPVVEILKLIITSFLFIFLVPYIRLQSIHQPTMHLIQYHS